MIASDRIYDACASDAVVAEEFNVADLKVTLSDSQLRCRPDSLKFVGGQATVVCSLEEGIDKIFGAYSAPLIIEMSYGYSTSLSKSFELKRII